MLKITFNGNKNIHSCAHTFMLHTLLTLTYKWTLVRLHHHCIQFTFEAHDVFWYVHIHVANSTDVNMPRILCDVTPPLHFAKNADDRFICLFVFFFFSSFPQEHSSSVVITYTIIEKDVSNHRAFFQTNPNPNPQTTQEKQQTQPRSLPPQPNI